MEINTRDAASFAEIVNNWGLPTPASRHYDEVFGPYHLDDGPHFLSYKGQGRQWSVRGQQAKSNALGLAGLRSIEISEVQERLDELRSMERPRVFDPEQPQTERPFVYKGWAFQWIYSPALYRWELAPIGRE